LITAIIVLVIIIIAAGLAGIIWFISYKRRLTQGGKVTTGAKAEGLPFRWSYIMVPLAIFLLSIILSAYFYHLLPTEVAVHFKVDGTPDRWLSRETTLFLVLVPQVLLVLLAAAIAWGITKLAARFWQPGGTRTNLETILSLMGNMIALPQIVLCFAMLDIFVYNAYQIHLLPLWMFALIFMVSGGIVMGMFFVRAIRQEWGARR
jgi:uncharacterized membrane protein